jgi:hypothetical protein
MHLCGLNMDRGRYDRVIEGPTESKSKNMDCALDCAKIRIFRNLTRIDLQKKKLQMATSSSSLI